MKTVYILNFCVYNYSGTKFLNNQCLIIKEGHFCLQCIILHSKSDHFMWQEAGLQPRPSQFSICWGPLVLVYTLQLKLDFYWQYLKVLEMVSCICCCLSSFLQKTMCFCCIHTGVQKRCQNLCCILVWIHCLNKKGCSNIICNYNNSR
jgi:hypothetical protein